MRLTAMLVLVCSAGLASAEQSSKQPRKDKTPVVMRGCVAAGSARQFTFTDSKDRSTYRLTGADVAKYVGQEVQIVGGPDTRRFRVAGGLTPTPNVAGQAGAIDPARAAVAAGGGGTTGTGAPDLPEFRVTRVSAIAGRCSQ
jgi:hypothetical protein